MRELPFEKVAANFLITNEQERAALREEYAATRALYVRWQRDLLASVPTARIVELQGASLFMFQSNEADVLREIRTFAATLLASQRFGGIDAKAASGRPQRREDADNQHERGRAGKDAGNRQAADLFNRHVPPDEIGGKHPRR